MNRDGFCHLLRPPTPASRLHAGNDRTPTDDLLSVQHATARRDLLLRLALTLDLSQYLLFPIRLADFADFATSIFVSTRSIGFQPPQST